MDESHYGDYAHIFFFISLLTLKVVRFLMKLEIWIDDMKENMLFFFCGIKFGCYGNKHTKIYTTTCIPILKAMVPFYCQG